MCVFDCTFSLGRRLMVLSGRSTLRTLRDLMTLMSFPLLLPLRSGGKQQDINMLYNENERVIRTFWKTVSIYFHHISLLDHSLSFHFTLNVEDRFNITMQQLILFYIRILCCRLLCCGMHFIKNIFFLSSKFSQAFRFSTIDCFWFTCFLLWTFQKHNTFK